MDTSNLISNLSAELEPVKRPYPVGIEVCLWAIVSIPFVLSVTALTGPFRPGFLTQLVESPRFFIETFLGIAVAIFAAYSGILHAIPGAKETKAFQNITIVGAFVWVTFFLYGLLNPSLEPSMVGKRPYCFYETLMYAIVPFAMLFFTLKQGATIMRGTAGALIGISACVLPAVAMQVACMYDPYHVLTMHLFPVVIISTAGTVWCVSQLDKV